MKEIIKEISKELRVTRPEAELIVASLVEKPRFEIYYKNELDEYAASILKIRLKELKNGVPIEYLTKKVQFMDLSLKIYPGVFIPRLETEYFVELIEKNIESKPRKILEIGTGCGAVAISLARVFTGALIVATDISDRAIINAQENIRAYGLEEQVMLVRLNSFSGLDGKFDLIVSNPPYIPSTRLRLLPKSVRDFEPCIAINGGQHGIMFIKNLVKSAYEYLASNGAMAIEIDNDEVGILEEFLDKTPFEFDFKKDLFNQMRYLLIGKWRK